MGITFTKMVYKHCSKEGPQYDIVYQYG